MQIYWKIPPKVKIYEALGCIADNHVEFISEKEAIVTSSEGNRKYHVSFDLENNFINSDDNGSKFKGYLGYPSIAVLMLKGILPFDKRISDALKGIKWKRLNDKFKDYNKTIEEALRIAKERGVDEKEIENFVSQVMYEIKSKKFVRFLSKGKQKTLL
ncbi:MAG: hypothetical protein QXJ96_01030 [Candidatus Aenigmatarchaeota archaeon]|nr:hypothetical protein [Candidatus Aenigmarchaeota archaeon]